jgi:hypothetical protein
VIPLPILGFGKALIGSKPFLYALAGFLALVGWNVWIWKHDAKVEKAAVENIDKQARKKTTEAIKARAPAAMPGSEDRLKQRFCIDCGGAK